MTPVISPTQQPNKLYLGVAAASAAYMATTKVWPLKKVFSDNFNRANGALGANWIAMTTGTTSPAFDSQINIVGNQAVSNGASGGHNAGDYWNDSFSNDQFSQIKIATMPGVGAWAGVLVRAAPTTHYLAIAFNNTSTGPEIDLYKMIASSWTLVAGGGGVFAAGDIFRLEAQGTTLRVKVNGATRITAPDSALTAGRPGIATAGIVTMDDWQGGEL